MNPASRTPEGNRQRCPVCGNEVVIEPSQPSGDAPCPHCGQLLWFDPIGEIFRRYEISPTECSQPSDAAMHVAGGSYRKGADAMAKENWQFAVAMFMNCSRFIPDNAMYRKVLRGTEYRMYGDNRMGASTACRHIHIIQGQIEAAKLQQDWETVDRLAESGLRWNPWHTELNFDLGLAGLARGYRDVALFAFRCALDSSPDRADIRAIVAELEAA